MHSKCTRAPLTNRLLNAHAACQQTQRLGGLPVTALELADGLSGRGMEPGHLRRDTLRVKDALERPLVIISAQVDTRHVEFVMSSPLTANGALSQIKFAVQLDRLVGVPQFDGDRATVNGGVLGVHLEAVRIAAVSRADPDRF